METIEDNNMKIKPEPKLMANRTRSQKFQGFYFPTKHHAISRTFFIVKEILKLNEMSLHVLFNITENRLGLILLHFERKLIWNDKSDKLTIM